MGDGAPATTVMIKSALDTKCVIFSGNGNDKHPSRHDWGSGNEFCGFPGGKSALLNNKQGVFVITGLTGTFPSSVPEKGTPGNPTCPKGMTILTDESQCLSKATVDALGAKKFRSAMAFPDF